MSMSVRQQKVASLWAQTIAKILIDEIELPYATWSLTAVLPTPDLKTARVMISAIDEQGDELVDLLNARKTYLSHLLAQRITSKFSPKLIFMRDDTQDRAAQIDSIIDEL